MLAVMASGTRGDVSMRRWRDGSVSFRACATLVVLLVTSALTGGVRTSYGQQADQAKRPEAPDVRLEGAGARLPKAGALRYLRTAAVVAPAAIGERGNAAAGTGGGATYRILHLEFTNAAKRREFRLSGVAPVAAVGRFADVFLDADRNPQVDDDLFNAGLHGDSTGLIRFQADVPVRVPPAPVLVLGPVRRLTPEAIVRGGLSDLGLTGRDVIIVILDSGIDFRRADFQTNGCTSFPASRLLYLWDLTSPLYDATHVGIEPPLRYPNGRHVGTLYTQADLTSSLRIGTPVIPPTDHEGHGTAAASIAAGNGGAARCARDLDPKYVGVAPNADVIGVSLGGDLRYQGLLTPIIQWAMGVADSAKKPVVFSYSAGGHGGGHDGTTIQELELDALFPPKAQGRAILIAAGNEGDSRMHARVRVGPVNSVGATAIRWSWHGTRREGTWDQAKQAVVPTNELQVFFKLPLGARAPTFTHFAVDHTTFLLGDDGKPFEGVTWNPDSREWSYFVDVVAATDGVEQGADGRSHPFGHGQLTLFTDSGPVLDAQVYLASKASFDQSIAVTDMPEQVASPGTALAAITVGSYDWSSEFNGRDNIEDVCGGNITPGQLSCYSNPGYVRPTGVRVARDLVKPDIVAPGEIYYASYARVLPGNQPETCTEKWVAAGCDYKWFDGTSAATPYAAGVVALMLQKNPALTAGVLKEILREEATKDPETLGTTSPPPNAQWGGGKLDYAAVLRAVDAAGKAWVRTLGPVQPPAKPPQP